MLNNMKYLTILFTILLTGCASIPEEETGRFNIDMELSETAILLEGLARKCWFVSSSDSNSRVIINTRKYPDKFAITATLGGDRMFFVAVINSLGKQSVVVTHEGNYACGLRGCWALDLTSDLKRWSEGDQTCRTEPLDLEDLI